MFENKFLSEFSEEEYGSGDELSSTGYLIFGILTFWIYNVWMYHDRLSRHLKNRLEYFRGHLKEELFEGVDKPQIDQIVKAGFGISRYPRNISILLYALSFLLLFGEVVAQMLVADQYISFQRFDLITKVFTALAAFFFCGATILFIGWMIQHFKKHEYNELLLYKFISSPESFKISQPSLLFKRRWEKNQNLIAFFLILSIPMTLSPIFAVSHVQSAIESNSNFAVSILVWSIIMFIFAGIFHLWGTKLLIMMYNGHLRIESMNRSQLSGDTKWVSGDASSVIDNRTETEPGGQVRELVPKRTLAAIMLTDMVGFSKDMEKNEGATYDKLLKHNDIIRHEIESNNGREVKTIGDAFLVKYASAVDAVRSAINIQNRFSGYNKTVEDHQKIHIRIGIHIGDILIMGTDVIGNGVNIAARIEPLAEVGGICISSDVYNIVKKSIDIRVTNLGVKELKNIQDAPEIYQIILQSMNASKTQDKQ